MPQEFTERFTFERGYWLTQGLGDNVPGTMIGGSNNCYPTPTGGVTGFTGISGALSTGYHANQVLTLVDTKIGGLTTGSIVRVGAYLFFIGSGDVYYDGSAIQSGVPANIAATSALQVWQIPGSNNARSAGLAIPVAPTLAAQAVATPETPADAPPITGTVAVKIAYVAADTGAIGTASPATIITGLAGQAIKITHPAASSGAAYYRVYVTPIQTGASGLYYLARPYVSGTPPVRTLNVPVGTDCYLAFNDGDLDYSEIAPIDHDAPPVGKFVFLVGNIMVVAGCLTNYDGLAPSVPGRYEAYPPDTIIRVSPTEAITAVLPLPSLNRAYVFTASNTHEVVATGDPAAPILSRPVLPFGVSGQNAVYVHDDVVYMCTAAGQLLRWSPGSEPDMSFAYPIVGYGNQFSGTPETVVISYDPRTRGVFFANGTTAYLFFPHLPNEPWSSLITLPGTINAALWSPTGTFSGFLLIVVTISAALSIRVFNNGGGGISWNAYSSWRDAGAPQHYKSLSGFSAEGCYFGGALNIYLNRDYNAASFDTVISGTGTSTTQNIPRKRVNATRIRTFAVQIAATSDSSGDNVTAVTVSGIIRDETA